MKKFVIWPAVRCAWMLTINTVATHPAWSSEISDGVPGPEMSSIGRPLQPVSALLELRGHRVVLSMQLAQRSGKTQLNIKAGPEFKWRGEADAYPDRQYPELEVTFDQQTLHLEEQVVVYSGGEDISKLVHDAGIDPFVIADSPPIVSRDLDTHPLAALMRTGALRYDADAGYLAQWSVRRSVKVTLASPKAGTLALRYKARPGFARLTLNELETSGKLRSYCTSSLQLQPWVAKGGGGAHVQVESFALPISIDEKIAPKLRFKAEPNSALVALCDFDGKAAIGRKGLELTPQVDARGRINVLVIR